MVTPKISSIDESGSGPIACALNVADLATQARRWRRLAKRALIQRIETETGLRIFFQAEPGVEDELRRLVAVENDCCAWATWTVQLEASQVELDVRSTDAGITTLHTMFTDLQPAKAAHRS